nr:hypothetical protein [Tanacetum cinerariifolium]
MSDVLSVVTYTSIYTDSEPWRYYGEESDETGSPRVIVYGYDGLPMQPVAPPFPDYVPGPEHPPSPDYVPSPKHPPSPVEPLPADASPIVASPGYVADFDPDEDPKEDPEDDHADYPEDGGDGDDDDTDDEDEDPFEDEEDDKEEDTEALEADEPTPTPGSPHIIIPLSQTRLRRAWKTVRPEPSMSASMEACISRHAALPSPPLPVPSLPLPLPSTLTTSPTDTGEPLGYRAARIRMRALLPSTSHRTDILEADVPPWKRACLTTPAPRFEVRESSTAGATKQPRPTEFDRRRYRVEQAGYGITDTRDEIVDNLMEIAPTTLKGVDQRVTELDTTVRQRTDKDRLDHHRTTMLLDREAMYAREAWAGSEDRSAAIAAHVRTLEAQVAALIAQTSSLDFCLSFSYHFIYLIKDCGLISFILHLPSYYYDCMKSNAYYTSCDLEENGTQEKNYESNTRHHNYPYITVTDAQLQALIDQGVAAALAERDVDRSKNGDNNNDLGTGRRRQMTTPRE